ncbi:hypothetical protein SteCoe_3599 [Stentor coeruleus]|uniref:Major facilitator superfamily (MFS) profile domain-containing protein n=1 Tax=Stentor coeruleus TaxID=5963 RepID=A0A1R2CWU4_9CILI|nr:hypothetical protein SteCoe_3599 [Stentor coeruleus]
MAKKLQQISDLIDEIGWGKYNYINFIVCGMSWGSVMLWGSTVPITINEAGEQWNLSNFEEGLLGSSHTLGLLIGSYFWGYLGNEKGLLKNLQIVSLLACVFGLCYMLSVNYYMLLLSIVCVGFCNGGSFVLGGTLYSESLPISKNWTMVMLSICTVIGGILAYVSAIFMILIGTGSIALWRWVAGISLILQIIFWISSFLIFESVKFLARKDRCTEAVYILKKISIINKKEVEIALLHPIDYTKINEPTNESEDQDQSSKSKLSDLFSKQHSKKSILFGLSQFLGDAAYGSLQAFMPILLQNLGSNLSSRLEIYSTVLAQVCLGIPGSILSSYLVTTFLGMKWTICLGFVLSGICVFLFLISNVYWMVLLTTSFINFFDFLGYSSSQAIVQESYPVRIRSLGVGWTNACCKFGGFISPIIIGLIFEVDGGMTLGVFIIAIFFGLVGVCACFLDEPKGKEPGF